jgi:hypothetical protein
LASKPVKGQLSNRSAFRPAARGAPEGLPLAGSPKITYQTSLKNGKAIASNKMDG